MRCPPIEEATYQWLKRRVGRCHLDQRLGIERDYEARVFGHGLNLFHIENWYSVHHLIRNSLRVMLLHGRGRRNARRIQLPGSDLDGVHLGAANPWDVAVTASVRCLCADR